MSPPATAPADSLVIHAAIPVEAVMALVVVATAIGLAGLALWWRDARRARRRQERIGRRLQEL